MQSRLQNRSRFLIYLIRSEQQLSLDYSFVTVPSLAKYLDKTVKNDYT